MSVASPQSMLAFPPLDILESSSLFIDFDGTLVDIVDEPDAVVVDPELIVLLTDLAHRQGNRIALVSGRSILQLDGFLGPLARNIALSGSHGSEYRWNGVAAQPARPNSLDAVEHEMKCLAAGHPGSIVEAKSYGVALHYRLAPDFEAQAQSLAAGLADRFGLALQHGRMMVEVRVPGGDKGVAVATMMRRPEMSGTRPIFIGDDITDEHGFAAARALGGVGILVGQERATAASYRVPDPTALRRWLAGTGT